MKKKSQIAALVPLKLNSRRLPNKNFLRLGERPLAYHIFDTLSRVNGVDETYCFTSQAQIMELLPDGVSLLIRPKRLDGDEIKANELFFHAISNIDAEWIVLCHATAPFLGKSSIERGIEAVLSGDHDCAFSVEKQQTYCWYDGKPLNYDPKNMSQTQALKPVLSETSGFYIFRRDDYLKNNTRIGSRPCLIEISDREAVDIDNPEDFTLAAHMLSYRPEESGYCTDDTFIRQANRPNPLKNVHLVCFELEGVLLNFLPLKEASLSKAIEACGLALDPKHVTEQLGLPIVQILSELEVPQDKRDAVAKAYESHYLADLDQVRPFPDAAASVKKLSDSGLQISALSPLTKTITTDLISKLLGDLRIDCVVSSEEVRSERWLPHPDPLLLSCVKLGFDPRRTAFVGSSETDRSASRDAGVHYIHANWGKGKLSKSKEISFNTLENLTEYLLDI